MLPLKLCTQIEIELFYVVYECVCMRVCDNFEVDFFVGIIFCTKFCLHFKNEWKKDKKNVVKPFEKWQVFQRASQFIEKKEEKTHIEICILCRCNYPIDLE